MYGFQPPPNLPLRQAQDSARSRGRDFSGLSLRSGGDTEGGEFALLACQVFCARSYNSTIAADYGVIGVPTYFVIGPDGKIVCTDRDEDELKAAAANALGE